MILIVKMASNSNVGSGLFKECFSAFFGFVSSVEEAREVLWRFEQFSTTSYVVLKRERGFGEGK